ncbi:DUF1269 domain-containing protein [Deinococcus sp. UYEF24]
MSNYVALVFKTDSKAHDALRMIWDMDKSGDLTVHGAAVVRRDNDGYVEVASKHTDAGMRTAVGIGVGVLLGALAGPIGIAAGVAGAAALSAGTAMGVGAVAGGAIGFMEDGVRTADRGDAVNASIYSLDYGESAVVADISEDWPARLDHAIKAMGGVVHRRFDANNSVGGYPGPDYSNYLYPYYYDVRV